MSARPRVVPTEDWRRHLPVGPASAADRDVGAALRDSALLAATATLGVGRGRVVARAAAASPCAVAAAADRRGANVPPSPGGGQPVTPGSQAVLMASATVDCNHVSKDGVARRGGRAPQFITRIRHIGRAGEQFESGTKAAATTQRPSIPANQSTAMMGPIVSVIGTQGTCGAKVTGDAATPDISLENSRARARHDAPHDRTLSPVGAHRPRHAGLNRENGANRRRLSPQLITPTPYHPRGRRACANPSPINPNPAPVTRTARPSCCPGERAGRTRSRPNRPCSS